MQLSALSVFKTPEITSTLEFLSSEAGASNNCSKQRLKLPGMCASVLEKDFIMYVFFHNIIEKAKKKFARQKNFFAMPMLMLTSMSMLMPRCRSRDIQMVMKK